VSVCERHVRWRKAHGYMYYVTIEYTCSLPTCMQSSTAELYRSVLVNVFSILCTGYTVYICKFYGVIL